MQFLFYSTTSERPGVDGERAQFRSKIPPPYMRKSPTVAEVLPISYLHGLSTGDFRQSSVGSQLLWTLPSQNHSPRFLTSHDPSISADPGPCCPALVGRSCWASGLTTAKGAGSEHMATSALLTGPGYVIR